MGIHASEVCLGGDTEANIEADFAFLESRLCKQRWESGKNVFLFSSEKTLWFSKPLLLSFLAR